MSQKGNLLCLDGGGIRGLIESKILEYIEAKTHRNIKESFEWIAGTSTGGLLALYLGLGKTAKQCTKLYLTLKDTIFGSNPYQDIVKCMSTGQKLNSLEELVNSHTAAYEQVLKQFFGETMKMSDIKNVKIIITVTLGNCDPMKLLHYTNYDPETKDELVWKVARATSAAPTFFQTFYMGDLGPLIDGGLIANNPTLTALAQIHKFRKQENKSHFLETTLSLGTGLSPVQEKMFPSLPTSTGPFKYLEYLKVIGNVPDLTNLLLNELTLADGHLVEQAEAFCYRAGVKYYRFNPHLGSNIDLNEIDNSKIEQMLTETESFIKANIVELNKCIFDISID